VVVAWVYILECADGGLYIGSHRGDDVMVRVSQHNAGLDPKAWTYRRRPVRLAWSEWFPRYDDAVAFERQLKSWSRGKKLALIRGDIAALKALAKRKRKTPG
jgi:putative endonuclease